MDKAPNPHPWAGLGARPAKGTNLKNVRKTLIVAAVTGTLVTVPGTATAYADAQRASTPTWPPPAPGPDAAPPAPDAAPPAPRRWALTRTFRPRRRMLRRRLLRRPALTRTFPRRRTLRRRPLRTPRPFTGRTASTGTPSLSVSPAVTGGSAPVTASPAACSSPPARGGPTVAPDRRTAPAVRSRSGWPRTSCIRRASAPGRSAAGVADQTQYGKCRAVGPALSVCGPIRR